MTWAAFALVLLSATLDASWNLLAKKERMTVPLYAAAITSNSILFSWYLAFAPVSPASLPRAFWIPCAVAVAATALFAIGLPLAYRFLDMTTAYPMMRALPILLVAGATSAFGIGTPLSGAAKAGMALVFAGCLVLGMRPSGRVRGTRLKAASPARQTRLKATSPVRQTRLKAASPARWAGFLFVLLVAVGTTVYTIFDSQAVAALRAVASDEAARRTAPLFYYEVRALLTVFVLWGAILVSPNMRAEAATVVRTRLRSAVTIGLGSSLAYMAILAAMPLASNVAYVHAFRQIGLAIGLLGGALVLRERISAPKIAGVALILAGLALSVL